MISYQPDGFNANGKTHNFFTTGKMRKQAEPEMERKRKTCAETQVFLK